MPVPPPRPGFDDRVVAHVEVGGGPPPLAGGQYEILGQAKYKGKKAENFLRALRALGGGPPDHPPPPYLLEGGAHLAGHQSPPPRIRPPVI